MIKQRKWLGILMALVMVFAMVPTLAFAGDTPEEPGPIGKPMATGEKSSDDDWTVRKMDDGSYYIVGYVGPETAEITIPSHVSGEKISGVDSGVFKDKTWLKKVTFETQGSQSVFGAFEGSGVEEVVLPAGEEFYFDRSFYYCENLTTINLQDLSGLFLGDSVFVGCTNLKSVQLPEGIERIGAGTFAHTGLEEINFPDSLETINDSAFFNCKLKNTPGKTLPDGETPCLYIPDNVTDIRTLAFLGNSQQYTAVSIPSGLSHAGVFKKDAPVKERKVTGKVSVSYNDGFSGATNEKAGDFPENSTYIVNSSFRHGYIGWIPLGPDGTLKKDEFYNNHDQYQLGTEAVVFHAVMDLNPVMKHPEDGAKDKRVRETPIYVNHHFPADVIITIPEYPSNTAWQNAIPSGKKFAGWKYNYTEEILQPGDTISTKGVFLGPSIESLDLEPQFEAIPPPTMISGKDSSWTKGSGKDLTFTSDGDFSAFIEVEVDGTMLTKDIDYTAAEGSTVVTLKSAYLETLPLGKHTIGIRSANGTAEGDFTVVAKAEPKPTDPSSPASPDGKTGTAGTVKTVKDGKMPKTGDPSSPGLMALLMVIGCTAAVTLWKRREN